MYSDTVTTIVQTSWKEKAAEGCMLYGSHKDHTRIAEKEIQFESGEIMDAVRITQGLVMDCGIVGLDLRRICTQSLGLLSSQNRCFGK